MNTKAWYDVLISIFMKKTFAFRKQTFAQTNYNICEFMSVKVSFVTPGIEKN